MNRSVFRVHFLKVAAKVRLVYRHDHIVRLGGSNVYCFGTSREGSVVTLPMEILLCLNEIDLLGPSLLGLVHDREV